MRPAIADFAPGTSDEWATPPELFAAAAALYGPFDLDAAASDINHKADRWIAEATDAFADWVDWGHLGCQGKVDRVWLNPPYSRGNLDRAMRKARSQVMARKVELVSCLVPGHTAEGWWHRYVEAPGVGVGKAGYRHTVIGSGHRVEYRDLAIEVLRIRGRVRFVEAGGATGSARFPSAIVTFMRPGLLPPLVTRGRPRIVTPVVEATVRAAVEQGVSISKACELGGIARKTWYRHLERSAR